LRSLRSGLFQPFRELSLLGLLDPKVQNLKSKT